MTAVIFQAILGVTVTQEYIYFVGRPYPHPEARVIIRHMGYKVGLLRDKNVSIHNQEEYDNVIDVDFTSATTLFASIANKNLKIDGLICTYENYIVAKSQLGKHFNLPAPTQKSSEMCTDKYLMRQAFMQADPSITPQFGLVTTEADVLKLARGLTYPLILKPTNLVKSLLVLRCNDETELLSNFTYAKERIADLYKKYRIYDRQPQLLVEEYIVGETCSIAAFIDKDGTPYFCEGVVSLTNAQEINVNDSFIYSRVLPGQFSDELTSRLYDTARKGIAALDMASTPAHIELIYNEKTVKLIEIGARIGGYRPRMYQLSYGIDLIKQEIKLALGQTPEFTGNFSGYSAVFELFPQTTGLFKAIEGEVDTSVFTYYAVKAREGVQIGPAKSGYKAAAIVIVNSADRQEFNKLCDSVSKLKVTINR